MTCEKHLYPPPAHGVTGSSDLMMPEGSSAMSFDSSESYLFDSVAQEVNSISGTDIEFYHLDIANSEKDPLYDESTERVFRGPYKLKAHVSYPEQNYLPQADGIIGLWDCTAWIARADLETVRAPAPQPGDVLHFWSIPFFNYEAVLEQKVQNSGLYFNVIRINTDGHLFDTPSFVGFKLTLKRRTDFTPERRLTNT